MQPARFSIIPFTNENKEYIANVLSTFLLWRVAGLRLLAANIGFGNLSPHMVLNYVG